MDYGAAEDVLIPITFFALALVIVIVAINAQYKRRLLEHKQRMMALEKGLPMPPSLVEEKVKPFNPYAAPLVWIFLGIGVGIFGMIIGTMELVGLAVIPLCIGIGLLIALIINQKKQAETEQKSHLPDIDTATTKT
jgi:preprotein translocase subunit YajC